MRNKLLAELERFFADFRSFNFQKRELILRAGDPIPGIYFLKRGFVRLYTVSSQGEELTLIIFQKGDIFPITWAVNGFSLASAKNYYLESLTNSELKRAGKSSFIKFIRSNPDAIFELTLRLTERLNGLLLRAESFVFGDAKSRVASILLICAQRFGKKTERGVEVQVPLTHSDIASLIGVARETASIEVKKFEKRGLIGRKGRLILIKNAAGLRKIVQAEQGE